VNEEGRPLADLGFERQSPGMFVHDDIVSNG
jgi:hypothetical protein